MSYITGIDGLTKSFTIGVHAKETAKHNIPNPASLDKLLRKGTGR